MITALLSLFVGWLFSLVGLDDLLYYLMGITTKQYYLIWFITGGVIWLENLFKRG